MACDPIHADHRHSRDHDHVVSDLADRFEVVLDAIENDDGWATNRVTPGKVILGNLDGVEAGVRQMIRTTPLETVEVEIPSGEHVVAPTLDETIRIKGFLAVRRNQVRDYLDLAALADHAGVDRAAKVLSDIDSYYADQNDSEDGIAAQLSRQLSSPHPADSSVISDLSSYRRLRHRWQDWNEVQSVLSQVALGMVAR